MNAVKLLTFLQQGNVVRINNESEYARFTRFLTRQTTAPYTGPIENDAISAGSSERSILIKDGISGTLKLKNISTDDSAERIIHNIP